MSHFIRPQLIRDDVYQHLRQAILEGELAPGNRLAEADLGKQLGVSRTPIREALQRLIQNGLLIAEANKGVKVRILSAIEAQETYIVREELDGLAAALAAQHYTPDDATALQNAFDQLKQAHQQDYRTQTQLDLAFHAQITHAAHNSTLSNLARDLEQRIALIKHQTRTYNAHPNTETQHAALLKAILERNTQTARDMARQHVQTFAKLVMQELAPSDHSDHLRTFPKQTKSQSGVNND